MKMIPVIKGQLGNSNYYIATMKASEVINTLRIPKETEEFQSLSVEETYQREINYKRVKDQIAPYFVNDPERFFNSLIVDIRNGDQMNYTALNEVVNMPGLFANFKDTFGILSLSGSELLVPLDGQHRLAGLKFAITGKDEKGNDIDSFSPNPSVQNDDITLIMLQADTQKARRIFNKVNRYAKATSKADNLIINEDDYLAVIARNIADEYFQGLINAKSNTIPNTSNFVTTLSAVYEGTKYYIQEKCNGGQKLALDMLPDQATQQLWSKEAKRLWVALIDGLTILKDALENPSIDNIANRNELRNDYILMKPIVQEATIQCITRCITNGADLENTIEKLNGLDWTFDNNLWENVAVNPGRRIIAGTGPKSFLGRFLAYLIGNDMDEKEIEILNSSYSKLFDGKRELPERD